MKNVVIALIFILSIAVGNFCCIEDTPVADPCEETPNCIPELSNWKLYYQPYNSDCMKCHTTCTLNASHSFCSAGGPWIVSEERCLSCHSDSTLHQ